MAASGTELSQEALAVLTRKQLRGYHRGLQERLEGAASLDAAERIQQLIRQTEDIAARQRWDLG